MSRVLRVVGVFVLAVVSGGCFWPAPGQNPGRTAYNPSETALTPATVGGLRQRWVWTSGASSRVFGAVASTAGIHVISDDDCRLATIKPTTGALAWDAHLSFYADVSLDDCGITTLGDPFVAGGRVWVGRQGVFIKQPPNPLTFTDSSTLGFELDGTPAAEWPGAMLDNIRGGQAHGVGGFITSTTLPPPFPPIPQYSFVTTASVGGVGTDWHTVGIPGERGSDPLGGRTLGESALYDAGTGLLTTVPGDATAGNGLRAYALAGATPGCDGGFDCPVWASPLDGTDAWQPVIADDGATVYTGTDAGTVYAVDATTGAVRWSAAVGSAVTGSVALAGDTLYVPTASGDLVALAAAGCGADTCDPVWSGATGGAIDRQPAVAGGVVYTASADGSLHAFAAAGCGGDAACPALWSAATGRRLSGGPIVSNGWLYATFDGDTAGQAGLLAFSQP